MKIEHQQKYYEIYSISGHLINSGDFDLSNTIKALSEEGREQILQFIK